MPAESEGPADIADCAREPIHLSEAIQPFGCMLVCGLDDWVISHVSANAATFLGLGTEVGMLGRPVEEIIERQVLHDLRNTLQGSMISGGAERLIDVVPVPGGARLDITTHASQNDVIIEFIPHAGADTSTTDPIVLVKGMVGRMKRAPNLGRFLQTAASQLRAVTGYDRVMIYKFLPDMSGEVVAEALRSGLQPFMGLRYPATDIPPQARALYKRQWLRMIVDVDYKPEPLLRAADAPDQPVDLSLSSLRSVSPIHLEYLRNMGSAATLTVSLMAGDELWGLIACHHEVPRRIASSSCSACEMFGQIFSLQIEAKEREEERDHMTRSHQALERLITTMPVDATLFDNLPGFEAQLKDIIPCDGLGIWSEGRFSSVGGVPPASAIPALVAFLDEKDPHQVFVTDALSEDFTPGSSFSDRVSGMIAIPFSRATRSYLFFFRREVLQIVTWGGNPNKPVEIRPDGLRIGPRKSFEAWRETVRGRSLPWRPAGKTIAESLRVSMLDVILRRTDLLNQERKAAQESQSLLIAELNHRVKNVLALVRSLIRQSRHGANTIEGFTNDLEHRIRAMAFAHDQLTQVGWKGAPLKRLLQAEVQAWAGNAGERVRMTGPAVTLTSRAYQTLALVLHEMMTNAAKYGALSQEGGLLTLDWSFDPDGALRIDWTEAGGPHVSPPQRRGFGTVIVEQTIPFELQGESKVDYRPGGVVGLFLVPAEHLLEADHASEAEGVELLPRETATGQRLTGKRLLLVEDSMMIALDAQSMLEGAGMEIEIASNVADAKRALQVNAFDVAVLDVNLSGETSFPVADTLASSGVPFCFATGYGESIVIPDRFTGIAVVAKPYDERGLQRALAGAMT